MTSMASISNMNQETFTRPPNSNGQGQTILPSLPKFPSNGIPESNRTSINNSSNSRNNAGDVLQQTNNQNHQVQNSNNNNNRNNPNSAPTPTHQVSDEHAILDTLFYNEMKMMDSMYGSSNGGSLLNNSELSDLLEETTTSENRTSNQNNKGAGVASTNNTNNNNHIASQRGRASTMPNNYSAHAHQAPNSLAKNNSTNNLLADQHARSLSSAAGSIPLAKNNSNNMMNTTPQSTAAAAPTVANMTSLSNNNNTGVDSRGGGRNRSLSVGANLQQQPLSHPQTNTSKHLYQSGGSQQQKNNRQNTKQNNNIQPVIKNTQVIKNVNQSSKRQVHNQNSSQQVVMAVQNQASMPHQTQPQTWGAPTAPGNTIKPINVNVEINNNNNKNKNNSTGGGPMTGTKMPSPLKHPSQYSHTQNNSYNSHHPLRTHPVPILPHPHSQIQDNKQSSNGQQSMMQHPPNNNQHKIQHIKQLHQPLPLAKQHIPNQIIRPGAAPAPIPQSQNMNGQHILHPSIPQTTNNQHQPQPHQQNKPPFHNHQKKFHQVQQTNPPTAASIVRQNQPYVNKQYQPPQNQQVQVQVVQQTTKQHQVMQQRQYTPHQQQHFNKNPQYLQPRQPPPQQQQQQQQQIQQTKNNVVNNPNNNKFANNTSRQVQVQLAQAPPPTQNSQHSTSEEARKLVSQFAGLAEKLGINLPANVITSLTKAATIHHESSKKSHHHQQSSSVTASTAPQQIVSTNNKNTNHQANTILSHQSTSIPHIPVGGPSTIASPTALNNPTILQNQKTATAAIAAINSNSLHPTIGKSASNNKSSKLNNENQQNNSTNTNTTTAAGAAAASSTTNSSSSTTSSRPQPYSRKRKLPRLEECEQKLATLKTENDTLKRHLAVLANKTEKFDNERTQAEQKLREFAHIDKNTSTEDLDEFLKKFSHMYSDYGHHRHEQLGFHLNQLQQ